MGAHLFGTEKREMREMSDGATLSDGPVTQQPI